jgi:hypothetical protein
MMRRSFALLSTAFTLAALNSSSPLGAQVSVPPVNDAEFQRYSANQLDNLVGPIALYPDALLAQVLVAATFPDQVEDAARWVRANGTSGVDDQNWDVSVKSVAHYPSALNMMADKSDWTATLGRAYAYQSSEVMAAVQRMRSMANSQGNLMSTPQQQVVEDNGSYAIVPTQPRVIYVPVYDPYVIYTQPVFNVGYSSRYWSFGIGFPIGGWLTYDLDWRRRSVYYNGWNDAYFGYAGGWRGRSRPYVQITNIYINPRYSNVYVNRDFNRDWDRRVVNYRNVDRYAVGVHRDTYFDANHAQYRDRDGRDHFAGGLPRTATPRDEARDQRPITAPPGSLPSSADRRGGQGNAPGADDRNVRDDRNARRRESVIRTGDVTMQRPERGRPSEPGNAPRSQPNPGPNVDRSPAPRPEQRQAQPRVERQAPVMAPAPQQARPAQPQERRAAPREAPQRDSQQRDSRPQGNGERGNHDRRG